MFVIGKFIWNIDCIKHKTKVSLAIGGHKVRALVLNLKHNNCHYSRTFLIFFFVKILRPKVP